MFKAFFSLCSAFDRTKLAHTFVAGSCRTPETVFEQARITFCRLSSRLADAAIPICFLKDWDETSLIVDICELLTYANDDCDSANWLPLMGVRVTLLRAGCGNGN